MRFLRTDETIREGTPARGRPRPHSLDACPRRSFILSRGTDGTGRGLGRGSELRAAARGKRHGMREMIELQQVHRRYAMSGQTVHALAGVDLRIDAGEFVAVTGPSGSGKSSLLNILGCLDHPSSGRYLVEGRDVATLDDEAGSDQIGRAHVGTPVTNAHLVCRLLLEKKKIKQIKEIKTIRRNKIKKRNKEAQTKTHRTHRTNKHPKIQDTHYVKQHNIYREYLHKQVYTVIIIKYDLNKTHMIL